MTGLTTHVDDAPLRAWLARLRADGEASFDLDAATRFPAFTSTVLGSGSLVLRWYDEDPWVLALEPDIVPREAAALELAAGVPDVPAPRLVAWSPSAPAALLMTRLPGSTELLPPDVGALHDVLASIHAAPPGELARFHPYRGYHQGHAWPRPAWWRDRRPGSA